jgi:hypothetical protein
MPAPATIVRVPIARVGADNRYLSRAPSAAKACWEQLWNTVQVDVSTTFESPTLTGEDGPSFRTR